MNFKITTNNICLQIEKKWDYFFQEKKFYILSVAQLMWLIWGGRYNSFALITTVVELIDYLLGMESTQIIILCKPMNDQQFNCS